MSQWVAAFVQRLRELGWIEGRTVAIEYRWAEGRSERFAEIAAGPHAIQIRCYNITLFSATISFATFTYSSDESTGNPLPARARECGHGVDVLDDHVPVHHWLCFCTKAPPTE